MNHTSKKLTDTQVELTVTVGPEDLAEAKKYALGRLSRDIKVAGFRKGKVPANVAEKHLDPNVLANEAIERAINASLTEAIRSDDLRVLDQPKIELKKFVPYDELEYEAVAEIVPDIKLGKYTKLKVKRNVKKVEQSDVDEVLNRIRQNMAEKKEVKRDAKDGDEVIIDFTGKKDGEAFEGGTAKDYAIVLGSKTFIPGFEEAIVGHKVGDEFDVPLTFPKDYHAENLKGQKVVFEVKLHKISEVVLPEVDDEFAKKVGQMDSKQAMLDDVKRELEAQNERLADNEYQDALVMAVVEGSKVPLPQILVDDQMRSALQDAQQNLMYRGMTPDDYMKQIGYADEEEWKEKEFKSLAENRVKAGLVLAELSKVEKIEVSKEELEARHAQMLEQYPNMREQLDTPEARGDLVNRLVTEKTVQRLVELNS